MRYGLTQFGRAVAAGLVTAAGVALCSAVASAHVEKYQFASGFAQANAVAAGDSRRKANAIPQPLVCSATVSGVGSTEFHTPSGLALAVASAAGRANAEFFAAGDAAVQAQIFSAGVRRARMYPLRANGVATGEGQGFIYELAYAQPARAKASGFGTTYLLGYGHALALADADGTPAWASGGSGQGTAEAAATGKMCYIAGGGSEGVALASLWGDAAVTRAGVRHFEGVGTATARADGVVNTVGIYQSQTARAYAHLFETPVHIVGGSGRAVSLASGEADALVSDTAATLETGNVSAVATGRARVDLHGVGHSFSNSSAVASALVTHTKSYGVAVQAKALATASGKITNTKASPDTVYGEAAARARMSRISIGHAQAAGASVTTTNTRFLRTVAAVGVGLAEAELHCTPRKTLVFAGWARGYATLSAYLMVGVRAVVAQASSVWDVKPTRTRVFAGVAQANATSRGANQINDLLRAPGARTVLVVASPRLVELDAEDRRLAA